MENLGRRLVRTTTTRYIDGEVDPTEVTEHEEYRQVYQRVDGRHVINWMSGTSFVQEREDGSFHRDEVIRFGKSKHTSESFIDEIIAQSPPSNMGFR